MRKKKESGVRLDLCEQRLLARRAEALATIRENDMPGLRAIVEGMPEICRRIEWACEPSMGLRGTTPVLGEAIKGLSLLEQAICMRRARMVEFLAPLSDAGEANSFGETPLMLAISYNDESDKLQQMLLALIPLSDANKVNPANKATALMMAATVGNAIGIEMLLPHSDARMARDDGMTALHCAIDGLCWSGECVDLLLPASDLEARNQAGLTALGLAKSEGFGKIERAIEKFMAQEEKKAIDASIGAGREAGAGKGNARL